MLASEATFTVLNDIVQGGAMFYIYTANVTLHSKRKFLCLTKRLLCCIIISCLLALNSQAVSVTNRHSLPTLSYETQVGYFY